MRHPEIDLMILNERRREELAEAAHSRLVKEALAAAREARGLPARRLSNTLALVLARILSWSGAHMLNWSCRLQYRYALLAGGVADGSNNPCAS